MNGHLAAETRRRGEAQRNALERAQHAFARASALLTEPSPDNMGEALFWAARGTLYLADADPERLAADRAESIVRSLSQQPAVPGPYSGT